MNTCVILTARKEIDTQRPYPLMPINEDGECLLGRTLRLLSDRAFKSIILVVGYKAEEYAHLASENILIVENKDYAVTGSMASLAVAAEYIKEDFILIESDLLFERTALDALINNHSKNCFTIVSESGSNDEAYVETDNGFVTKISKDIHQVNHINGEMIGLTKISYETLRKMMLAWEKNNNLKLNYEYLLMDCTEKHERNFIKHLDLICQDVDCRKDFQTLRDVTFRKLCKRENPFDHENILSHIREIYPDLDASTPISIEYVGGMTNRNFKVCIGEKAYILRIPGNGTSEMIQRKNEAVNSALGHSLGITPPLVYYNNTTGIKLSEFIIDAETFTPATIKRKDHILAVISLLKRMHNSKVRLNNEFNIFHEIEKYESILHRHNATMYEGWEELRAEVFALEKRLNILGVNLAPCHNDPVAENFIKSQDGTVYLIDWEYSGINDPLSDIAVLLLESDFNDEDTDFILENYYQGEVPEHTKEKIIIYQILLDYLWSVWTVIKESQGDDFGCYGINRFNRAKTNLHKLK